MFCWLLRAAPMTVASWLLLELEKTEGKQKCRDPYQGILIVCPGNEYFCCGEVCCTDPKPKVAPLYSAWYFWIAVFVVVCFTVSLVVACVMCCKKSRKDVLIRLKRSLPNAVLRTTRNSHGIIQPDVTFYQRPPTKDTSTSLCTTHCTNFRLTTPIRPLTPAYQPTQPVTVTTVSVPTSCDDLTLPPGYVTSRDIRKSH